MRLSCSPNGSIAIPSKSSCSPAGRNRTAPQKALTRSRNRQLSCHWSRRRWAARASA
jgi:hypothetical protein